MTDPRTTQMFVRAIAVTGSHIRLVPQSEIEEVEDELERVRAELEPLNRAEAALLKRREELYAQQGDAA